MKRRIAQYLVFIIALVCCFSSSNAMAKSLGEYDDSLEIHAENYTYEFIQSQILSNDALCEWNDTTKINNVVALYNINEDINGYIFNLSTNDMPKGYLHLDYISGIFKVRSYSFNGIHELYGLQEVYGISNMMKKSSKVYYNGWSSYWTKISEDKFESLVSPQKIILTKDKLQEEYCEHLSKEEDDVELRSYESGTTMVSGYTSESSLSLVQMSLYSGLTINGTTVTDHCTPTAGTNIIKYYALIKGFSALRPSTDKAVFTDMYKEMDTNFNQSGGGFSGTYFDPFYSDGYAGLKSYCTLYNKTPVYYDRTYWFPSFSEVCSIISNKNAPLLMTLNNFDGTSGYHSVVVFGYKDSRIVIATGWDQSLHYYTYSSLNVTEYSYVGW